MDDMFKMFEVTPEELESLKAGIKPYMEQFKEGLINLTELTRLLEGHKVIVHWIQRVNPTIILTFIVLNDKDQQSTVIFEERF